MEVTIKGDVKEIASLVTQLKERQGFNVVKEVPAGKHQALPEAPAGQSRQEGSKELRKRDNTPILEHSCSLYPNRNVWTEEFKGC